MKVGKVMLNCYERLEIRRFELYIGSKLILFFVVIWVIGYLINLWIWLIRYLGRL